MGNKVFYRFPLNSFLPDLPSFPLPRSGRGMNSQDIYGIKAPFHLAGRVWGEVSLNVYEQMDYLLSPFISGGISLYITGVTSLAISVEVISPPMITYARGE